MIKRSFLVAAAAAALMLPSVSSMGVATVAADDLINCDINRVDTAPDDQEQVMLSMINAYRSELGLPVFAFSPTLQRIAIWKADQLATVTSGVLNHDDPTRTWDQRFLDCGYPSSAYFSENVGSTNGSLDLLLRTWKASPIHDPNLRDPNSTYIGIGHTASVTGEVIWVTEFGSDPS